MQHVCAGCRRGIPLPPSPGRFDLQIALSCAGPSISLSRSLLLSLSLPLLYHPCCTTADRPMYYNGILDTNFSQLENLLVTYKVDLVLTGHVHNAQVTCPIINNQCVTPPGDGSYAAPVHVVLGNAGQTVTPLVTPQPATIDFQGAYHGYSTLSIASPSSLTLNFYADSDNSLQYSLAINRAPPTA